MLHYYLLEFPDVRKRQAAKKQTLLDKKPLELLNDIIEGVKYCYLSYPNGDHECLAKIHGQCFSGKCTSLRAAQLKSVKKILKNIFEIDFDPSSAILSTVAYDRFGDEIER